jgi:predicted porin
MHLNTSLYFFFVLFILSASGIINPAFADELKPGTRTETSHESAADDKQEVTIEQEQAREREQEVSEDPLAKRQIDKVDQPEEVKKEKDLLLNGYASLRYRYRRYEGESIFGDSDTRVGGGVSWRFKENWRVFANAEIGISILDEVDALLNPKGGTTEKGLGDTAFRRLLYVGLETPRNTLTLGKNWSTYYQVSSYTDRFQGTGGRASGTYNAGTDGGPTGTGRADQVLQTRLLLPRPLKLVDSKPFNANIQLQYGNPIPQIEDRNYGIGLGLSAQLVTTGDFTAGLAYNFANISNFNDPEFKAAGIDGDAHALLLGLKWFDENWYIATTLARLLNHETTDEDIYFHGTGWEVYAQRRVYSRWWLVGGWNWLRPDADQEQAGDYELKFGVLGMRYSFDEFRRMLYANIQFSEGSTASGESTSNFFTVGVRWDFP